MTELTFEKGLPAALVQADNLPTLPTVAVEVLQITSDPDCSLDDLAEVLSRDPTLSSKLLKNYMIGVLNKFAFECNRD